MMSGRKLKPTLTPPSPECTIKNEFGTKQTGYVAREQLLAFLRATFPTVKDFGAKVW
jgi:hypothetical protein